MFGIDDAIIGSVVGSLGSAAIGGGLDFLGQSSANDANQKIAQQTNDYNAAQASLTRDYNAAEAEKTRIFNADEAQKNRDFQERQSNSSYQRAIKDLQAAGLNPMLAYQQGGASTPSGAVGLGGQASASSASGVSSRMENALSGTGRAVSNINPTDLAFRVAEMRNLTETNKQIQANTAESESRTRLNESNDLKTLAEMFKSVAEIEYVKQQTKTSSAQEGYNRAGAAGIEAQRSKDRAIQPLYDAGGSMIDTIMNKLKGSQLFNSSSYNFGRK